MLSKPLDLYVFIIHILIISRLEANITLFKNNIMLGAKTPLNDSRHSNIFYKYL